jgi:hypothetical protein
MKQTATEFLFEKLWNEPKDKLTWNAILEQAKEMEKQEIIEACNLQRNDYKGMPTYNKSGEQYYKETYGK